MSKENSAVTLSWEYAKETYGLALPFLMTAKLTVSELCVSYSGFVYSGYRMRIICAVSKRTNAIMYAISGKSSNWLRSLEKLFVAVARSAVFSSQAVQCNVLATCLAMNVPRASTGGISCSFLVCNLCVCSIKSPLAALCSLLPRHWEHIANSCPLLQHYSLP